MASDTLGLYKLLARLGSGGTGTVFKAQQTNLDRTVALKVLHAQYGRDQQLLKRFKREIQISASLTHPNLLRVFDAGQEGDQHYFSMEYIDGFPLRERLRGGKSIPALESVKIVRQMVDAMRYFHARSMVHRDIKPENVMVDSKGVVKLMDFGIVKVLDQTILTQAGCTLGTPRYMSPEMVMGEHQDHRSDIFQLGVMLYEMIAGKTPFDGPSLSDIAAAITEAEPTSLTTRVEGLPARIDLVMKKCLAKEAADRYPDVDALDIDLALVEKELTRPQTRTPRIDAAAAGASEGGEAQGAPPARSPSIQRPAVQPRTAPIPIQQSVGTGAQPGPSPFNAQLDRSSGARTLVEVTDWVERSVRSVSKGLADSPSRWGVVLAPLAFAIGLVAVWWLPTGYRLTSPVTVVPGLAGFEARWETSVPSRTEVEVRESGAVESRTFRTASDKADRLHSIVVAQLKSGGEYQVRVRHPDGSQAEPVSVKLPTTTVLLTGRPRGTTRSDGRVELAIQTIVPVQLRLDPPAPDVIVDPPTGWSNQFRIALPRSTPDRPSVPTKLVLDAVDAHHEEPLPSVVDGPRLGRLLASQLGALSDRDMESLGVRVARILKGPSRKNVSVGATLNTTVQAVESARSMVRGWLRDRKLEEPLESARALASTVMGDEGVDLETRAQIYNGLQRLEDLDYIGYEMANRPLLDVAALYRPMVRVDYPPSAGSAVAFLDNTSGVVNYMTRAYRKQYEGIFVRFDGTHYIQGALEGVDLSAASNKFHGSSVAEFTVRDEEKSGRSRLKLVFQIANMRSDVLLLANLNGKLPLHVRADPARKMSFDYKSMFMQNTELEGVASFVSVSVPTGYLVVGKNQLTVSSETVAGLGQVLGATLLRVFWTLEDAGV